MTMEGSKYTCVWTMAMGIVIVGILGGLNGVAARMIPNKAPAIFLECIAYDKLDEDFMSQNFYLSSEHCFDLMRNSTYEDYNLQLEINTELTMYCDKHVTVEDGSFIVALIVNLNGSNYHRDEILSLLRDLSDEFIVEFTVEHENLIFISITHIRRRCTIAEFFVETAYTGLKQSVLPNQLLNFRWNMMVPRHLGEFQLR